MFSKLFSAFSPKNTPNPAATETVAVYAPLSGRLRSLEEVADPAFSQKMLGDGLAIEPTSATVLAPFASTIVSLFPTGHAIGLCSPSGLECLIHIGIDTVSLQGKGFRLLVEQDQVVEQGTPLIELDLAFLRTTGKDLITPLVITNSGDWKITEAEKQESLTAGETRLFTAQRSSFQ